MKNGEELFRSISLRGRAEFHNYKLDEQDEQKISAANAELMSAITKVSREVFAEQLLLEALTGIRWTVECSTYPYSLSTPATMDVVFRPVEEK